MGVLGDDALGQQPLADLTAGAQRRVDVDSGPQPDATHLGDAVAHQGGQPLVQIGTQLGRPGLHLAGLQQLHHSQRHR